jgi:hypothetical protein
MRIDSVSKKPIENEDLYAHILNNLPMATLEQRRVNRSSQQKQKQHYLLEDLKDVVIPRCGKIGHKVADCGDLFCPYCKKGLSESEGQGRKRR